MKYQNRNGGSETMEVEKTMNQTVEKKSSLGIVLALMAGYSMVYMDKSMIQLLSPWLKTSI
jgi:hypothetical protein